ncbi:MAG: SpoIIE family protein phosphatase [Thermoanaerobaculia bacterium]|nr:SpoIIE family protein phosphatase [Thermoanaerobaculia bacterium]
MRAATLWKILLAAVVLIGAIWLVRLDVPVLSVLLRFGLLAVAILLALYLLWRLGRRLLWGVGRRLAFSYFLIGVLPIPMLLLVSVIVGYILNGFFLGHLYRDAVGGVRADLEHHAQQVLVDRDLGSTALEDVAFARYENGSRVGGSELAPADWPQWLEPGDETRSTARPRGSFVALPDGRPTLAAAAGSAERGVVAIHVGDLERDLRRRSGVWIQLLRSDAPEQPSLIQVQLGSYRIPIRPPDVKRGAEGRNDFFGIDEGVEASWYERPIVWWGELSPSLVSLEDGSEVAAYVVASLNGSPQRSLERFFSGSAEVDTAAWAALIAISGLLATIYLFAVIMALAIIVAITHAVNRLSRATSAVRTGDFSVRIPTRRRDQLGELQENFNRMTAHLEELVETAAQKELLDKELSLARDLQERLLPTELPTADAVEFATLFEPSAAIGGDYFDILRIDQDRLAVVIADVSGHGLPTGLRMAMVKAALVILIEEAKPPRKILSRLSELIRSSDEQRYFVTATIAVVDFRRGVVEITNAGHPPTYLLRGGSVREILLPGPPLGTLGGGYAQESVELDDGDILVWLSDGLIEGTDPAGEPFGYERLAEALEGDFANPAEARDELLAALAVHTAGHPADDDRTLVAMGYRRES